MTEQPDDRTEILFDRAVGLPPEEQAAFLDAACRGDPGLRAELESLLAHDRRTQTAGGWLESPLVRGPAGPPAGGAGPPPGGPGLPQRVGRYRVLRCLGEGGMGIVYEAEQDSPRRPVALKVIRPGLASPALVQRFAHEAQILGRLHHPGIAQVYEAGLAEDGRPFFAMEFVRGLRLDEYARRHGLDAAARAGLLARVCDAVQHAHDRGVVHRDLKPANILVDEAGQPKVLDFGVSRAAGAGLLTGAGLTQTGQVLGTPNYMSPEQVAAEPAAIDRRADVYALGVVLFELLAHRLPYQLEHRPLAEAARLILEQEPPRLGALDPGLRGDAETIVAKALEKERARRYPSAAELAADLRRWLAHEPIQARPASALYHLRKFARRHRGLVGGVVATGAALLLGLVGTVLFAVGEARQRAEAEYHLRQATEEKREAEIKEYRARVAAAVGALSAHDVADAARQLRAAPEHLRDWEWRHLRSRLDDSSAVIALPAGNSACLLGAPDRLQVVTFTSERLRLTDLESGKPRTLPIGPERGHLLGPAQTRHGLRVVVWVGNSTVNLLDEAGEVLRRVEIPGSNGPGPVVVSPDGKWLASLRPDGEWYRLVFVDTTSGKHTVVRDAHRDEIWALTFSPDGTRLASAGEDRIARLWDPATGALLAACQGHTSKILGAAFSPDGARLVTASADATVRQWNARTGEEVEAPYDRHLGEVVVATYSPDGQWVASAGLDRTIRVWRAKGRQDVAVLHGHTGGVVGVAFAPDGRRLVSQCTESPLSEGDGTVRVWEVDPTGTLPVLRGHTDYVYPVTFSPDGRWIASGSWDGTVLLWDAATGEPCATLRHPGIVPSLAYSPDGTWLVSGNYKDDQLRIWDVATARVRKEIQGPAGVFRFVTVSPDGKRVAATAHEAGSAYHLRVCDVESGEPLFTAKGWALAYSPDGRWLAVRDVDEKTILLLDAGTHEKVARLTGHKQLIFAAAFSPDGRRLASCSKDHTVRLWEIAPLTRRSPPGEGGQGRVSSRELRGHTDEVFAVAFHPGGTRLATGGRDRAVWLWDLARGEEVARLPGHRSYVWSLAFSPDGTALASGSGDSTVRLWDTMPLKTRYQARREAAALRPEAERLVERLFRQKKTAADVVAALRADGSLAEPLRRAALREVLRRGHE
jgi:WD40 repeat protein/predicted Ser/Thr protein kinase